MSEVSREQVLAFRLSRQHLEERVGPERLVEVAATGLQNTPPTSALLAVGARLRDCTPEILDEALYDRKSLLQFWSLRAAPYIVPIDDVPVFTTGLLSDDEDSCLYLMRGAQDHLRRFSLSATQAVEVTSAAVEVVLGARRRPWRPRRRARSWYGDSCASTGRATSPGSGTGPACPRPLPGHPGRWWPTS